MVSAAPGRGVKGTSNRETKPVRPVRSLHRGYIFGTEGGDPEVAKTVEPIVEEKLG